MISMLLDIDEIPEDAFEETLREQISLREAYLPRLTSRSLAAQMRSEIETLKARLEASTKGPL